MLLSVIPVDIATKRPLFEWAPYQHHRASERQVETWLRRWPNAGLAVVTGSVSQLVVVDVDEPGDAALTAARTLFGDTPRIATTPRDGHHLYFAHPGKTVKNAVRIKGVPFAIDIRGDGGYVVAPPTPGYKWIRRGAMDNLPVFKMPACAAGSKRPAAGAPPDLRPGRIRVGERNDVLYRRACCQRSRGNDFDEVRALLDLWNRRDCEAPLETTELDQIAQSAARHPIGKAREPEAPELQVVPADATAWI